MSDATHEARAEGRAMERRRIRATLRELRAVWRARMDAECRCVVEVGGRHATDCPAGMFGGFEGASRGYQALDEAIRACAPKGER